MWTDVDNSLSPYQYSGKRMRKSVDKACGQMCTNSRESRKKTDHFRTLSRTILARKNQPKSREFSRIGVTDFTPVFLSMECRQLGVFHSAMWTDC